ncbi:MAG: AMMECR1 domain-containing protein [Geobacter sp.]|nr:AMMECR1 domain-containing protein [Geobacter sp.]
MRCRYALLALLFCLLAITASAEPLARTDQDALLQYARQVMLSRLDQANAPPAPASTAAAQQRACFVTFFVKRQVMACFGSFTPRHATLHEEISDNIRLALKNDPRAIRLTPELAKVAEIQITFPQPPQPISDWRTVDALHEGLLVEGPDGRGVAIVPGEARTAHYAWRSALQRLGLNERSSGVRLYRFKAEWVRSHNL